ncbi:MAG: CYTH domain-containing protein [Pegethrix bostrychoides GSE-TBD4-15B]|jgi:CYTH domain-containing protein|uniref:CYTH domain-containing protein n=1 Tax=Pegethrix bostrychoides GSE-TBD4-15B TaxID=2839662 RepID=A0A951U6H8_9CYAN|nr:CYTH domain-containing protein [Pegethrix bostrychoides GSE-TBD4-15B]
MGIEIERKFLVQNEGWRGLAEGILYRQGYLASRPGCTVRVRVAGNQGYLTIKGSTAGISRAEYEYGIPLEDAAQLLDRLCQLPLIEKTRYRIPVASGLVWEVDEFAGENQGLIVAEIELSQADQSIELPDWIGLEVSDDPRYFNANLVNHPYCRW